MEDKNIKDALYLAQVTLLIILITFFIISYFVKELEVIYKILLTLIFALIGYNGRDINSKVITYLYYFASFCILISVIVGVS